MIERRTKPASPSLDLRVPAAVLRVWVDQSATDPEATRSAISRYLLGQSGIYQVGPSVFAIVPEADPAPFDTAIYWCRTLPEALRRSGGAEAAPLRMLISPGEVILGEEQAELVPDAPSEDFRKKPPDLAADEVHLTRWAVYQLEQPWRFEPAPKYEGPSGRGLPLVRADSPSFAPAPWRNPELLSRRLNTVDRPGLFEVLRGHLEEAALRIHGPIGCGKTRMVWDTLRRQSAQRLWLRARPSRRRDASLAQQIVQQLLEPAPPQQKDRHHPRLVDPEHRNELAGPGSNPAESVLLAFDRLYESTGKLLYLVCDDFEQIDPADLEFLSQLLASPRLGTTYRLLLVGRSGGKVPPEFDGLAAVQIPPLNEKEMGDFADQIFAGLSLPQPVQDRLFEATRGYPFALEEGMLALIRDKSVRRIYGSFFFRGDEAAGYRPSLRLVCHLQAEAARLSRPAPLYLLSLLEAGAPAADVAAAASSVRPETSAVWEQAGLESGLLQQVESPWGPGVTISCPAYAVSLARAIDADSLPAARHLLGRVLAARSERGEAYWEAYRLLQGTSEAIPLLLKALKTSFGAQLDREEVHEALGHELERHRERDGDEETELELLWSLLPLARRMGRLRQHTRDLTRGVELATGQPSRLLALAGVKAEMDVEAGRYDEAESTIRGALNAAEGSDQRRRTLLMMQLGRLFLRRERWAEAAELFRDLGRALSRHGPPALIAACHFHLGNIALHERRLEEAQKCHEDALEKRRAQSLLRPTGESLCALGAVAVARGHYPQALSYYREARKLLQEHGRETDRGYALYGLGKAWTRLGDYAAASNMLRRALEIRKGRDDVAGEAIARLALAENYLCLGQPDAALDEARQAHFHLTLLSLTSSLAKAEQLLGRIRLSQRKHDEAERHLASALDEHRRIGDRFAAGLDLGWLLEMALLTDNHDQIRRYTTDLREIVATREQADLGEHLDFRLYRGLVWLQDHGHKVGDPLPYLERAYREILRKASDLDPELRHRYLFQVPDNLEIVETATHCGVAQASGAGADQASGA